jgi:hypothetical protein
LAYALMTAHTRATRRLTLQFVGQGLLDESEVNAPTTDIGTANSSLAALAGSPVVMPPPQVPVASAPGKDVTLLTEAEKQAIFNAIPQTDAELALVAAYKAGPKGSIIDATDAQIKTFLKIADEQHPNLKPSIMDVKSDNVQDNVPKKRTRKPRGQKDISSPGQQIGVPVANIDAKGNLTSVPPLKIEESDNIPCDAVRNIPQSSDTASPHYMPLPIIEFSTQVPIAPDKLKEYRERLSKYSQDILPKAGLLPTDGIGGCTMKLKKFAELHVEATASKLSQEQFEELLGFLDRYVQQDGAKALVAHIDRALGVTK